MTPSTTFVVDTRQMSLRTMSCKSGAIHSRYHVLPLSRELFCNTRLIDGNKPSPQYLSGVLFFLDSAQGCVSKVPEKKLTAYRLTHDKAGFSCCGCSISRQDPICKHVIFTNMMLTTDAKAQLYIRITHPTLYDLAWAEPIKYVPPLRLPRTLVSPLHVPTPVTTTMIKCFPANTTLSARVLRYSLLE